MKKITIQLFVFAILIGGQSGLSQEIKTGENVAVTNTESGKVRGFVEDDT